MRRLSRLARAILAIMALALVAGCTHPPSPKQAPASDPAPPLYVSILGSRWTLSFNATFADSRLNTSVWGTCYPWAPPDGCTNFGNENEYEWYVPSQDQVYGSALHLVAQRAPTPGLARDGSPKEYSFRSGMVSTFPGYKFQYGYIQVVAHVPNRQGLWPAFWLLPANEQWPPEIDILELFGFRAYAYQHLYSVDYPTQEASEGEPNISVGWHVFGLYWSRHKLIWFIDRHQVMSATRGIPQQPMYFIADLAVDQQVRVNWGADSDALVIRSVRVWQSKP